MPLAMSNSRRAVVVGISGCSSSGKTTLSRLLRDIFPNTFVLHQDDFYRPEVELPKTHDFLDWDCAEALSIPDIANSLDHIHQNGTFPPELNSKEDQNSVGVCPVSSSTISSLKSMVQEWSSPDKPGHILTSEKALRLCVFDGFLLYSHSLAPIQSKIDIKLFLRVSSAKAKARRDARSGYVTLEGFWEDPPGYVDKVVWPNYVKDHEWMFENGDVEGIFKNGVVGNGAIRCQEGGVDVDIDTTLRWAVELLMEELPKIINDEQS